MSHLPNHIPAKMTLATHSMVNGLPVQKPHVQDSDMLALCEVMLDRILRANFTFKS